MRENGRCAYLKHSPARWYDSSGPTPEEFSCEHPESQGGSCAMDECPLNPLPVNPCPWCGEEMEGQETRHDREGLEYHSGCLEEQLQGVADIILDEWKHHGDQGGG